MPEETKMPETADDKKESSRNRSRSWIITQSADKITFEDLKETLKNYVYIGQLEQGKQGGEQGYKHYQIYIENPTQISFSTLKKILPNAHIETRQGTKKQAFDYVTKGETKIGEVFGNGDIDLIETAKDKKNSLAEILRMVEDGASDDEIAAVFPNQFFIHYRNIDMLRQLQVKKKSRGWKKIKVVYIYGETRSGKTRFVMDKYDSADIYRTTEYEFGWIDGYRGEKILVLDEYRSSLKISLLLDYTDGYIERIHGRNYPRYVCYDTVYLISNWKLHEQYPNMQKEKPEDWKAFLARIDEVYEFENGTARQIASPKEQTGAQKTNNKTLADYKLIPVDDGELPF